MNENKKKILIIGMTANLGGLETFLFERFKLLCSYAHFSFVWYESKMTFEESIRKLGGEVINLNISRTKNLLKFTKTIKHFFKQHHFDIIWLNECTISNAVCLKLAKQQGCNVRIIHAHNSSFQSQGIHGLLNRINHYYGKHFLLKYATDYWACSEKAGRFFYNNTGES
jgi:hypothetical protein